MRTTDALPHGTLCSTWIVPPCTSAASRQNKLAWRPGQNGSATASRPRRDPALFL